MRDGNQELSGADNARSSQDRERAGIDLLRLVFWIGLGGCAFAAAASAVLLPALGVMGRILLIGVGAGAIVLLIWIMHGGGRRLGLFPEKGAVDREFIAQRRAQYGFLDALNEAALITERSGAPVIANPAYLALARKLELSLDGDRPPSLDLLFGANPGFSGPIFRLARAAKGGKAHQESLPGIVVGENLEPQKLEALVSPLSGGKVLWRLRSVQTGIAAPAKALYLDEAPVGFFAAGPDGRIGYMNATLRAWLGLSADAPLPRLRDIFRTDATAILRRENRAAQRVEAMLRPRDAVEIPAVVVTTWPEAGEGDGLSRSVVFTPHIYSNAMAQRLAAPSPLRPERAGGNVLFDSMPFGVARLSGDDPSGSLIEDANPMLLHLTSGQALIGARFSDLFLAESGPAALAQALRDAAEKPQELQLAGEESRTVHVTITPGRQEAFAYLVDLTEKKKLEARLFQSEKLQSIGQLSGKLAHEFNNWLQAIRFRCDNLFRRHFQGDPSFEDINGIDQTVSEAAQIVRAMLAYSRQQTLTREVLDISSEFTDFVILLRQFVGDDVSIELSLGRELPFVKADRSQLFTAVMNLVVNARDALGGRSGGVVTIRTGRSNGVEARAQGFSHVLDGEYLLVDIADNGPGIAPDILGKIFEPFFTTKEIGKGTGLGLSTVWGVVKQSGGYIYPVSQLGKGTTFKIFLPVYDGPDRPASAEPPSAAPGRFDSLAGRGRILLVEDDHNVRVMLEQILQNFGYEVTPACDGFEALDLIGAAQPFDLIISDVVMPGMDGLKFLAAARPRIGDDLPVLFITGYTERDFETAFSDASAGRVALLRKPFSTTQVGRAVRDELAAAQRAPRERVHS